jgi:hypothetical protein
MTDTWVFLIRESDWDSVAYTPDKLGPDRAANDEAMLAHARFAQAVEELGVKITGGQALSNTKYGGYVDVSGDDPVYTDAPFTDSNEVITGFYSVECDEETARKLAAMVPSGNVVEWRKVHAFE